MAPIVKKSSPADRLETVDTSPNFTMTGTSDGHQGSGKTRFWLTAPEPIIVHLSDPAGLKGVIEEESIASKDIKQFPYTFDPTKHKDRKDRGRAAKDAFAEFIENYRWSLEQARTVIWDKEDYFWSMMRYAAWDGDDSNRANEYEDLYLEMGSYIYESFAHRINFGMIRGMTEIWKQVPKPGDPTKMQGAGTGLFKPRGNKRAPEIGQVELHHEWTKDEGFVIELGKMRTPGGINSIRGMRLTQADGIDLSFATIGQLAYPDSGEDDWK